MAKTYAEVNLTTKHESTIKHTVVTAVFSLSTGPTDYKYYVYSASV